MEKRTLLRRYWWVAALAVCAALASRAPNDLSVGDAAPALDLKEFLKGPPVAIEKGKTYVVEFWATWCGPCVATIPHLTELQKKYPEVVFIGIADEEAATVKAFVQQMGERMGYRVALDRNAAAGKEDSVGKTSQAWLVASGQNGIPVAFIVNRDRRVAWIGHPGSMDKVLEQVVAGTWDLQLAAKQSKLMRKLASVQSEGPAAVLKILDAAFADDPKLEESLGLQKFMILVQDKEAGSQAEQYGQRLLDRIFKDDAKALDNLAWIVVDPDPTRQRPAKPLVQLALRAANRADELTQGKDPSVADTLARAYFESGDVKKAIATQERAVTLAGGTPLQEDAKARLEEYKKAAQ